MIRRIAIGKFRKTAKRIRNYLFCNVPVIQNTFFVLSRKGFIPKGVWVKVQPIGVFTLKVKNSIFLYESYENDFLSRSLIWTNLQDWERTTINPFCEIAQKSRFFIDVGAYSGIYTLIACVANPHARVYAFEPNQNIFKNLDKNILLNKFEDRVKLFKEAVSDHAGHQNFWVPYDDPTAAQLTNGLDNVSIRVKTVMLDKVILNGPVDLIKIDEDMKCMSCKGQDTS